MMPKSVVCPISTITELCSWSRSIHSVEDIRSFAGVHPELYLAFLNVIVQVGGSPPEKRLKS